MAWQRINGQTYYYRSVREGGRVRSEYCGRGETAELLSLLDAGRREAREARGQAERAEREADRARERDLDDLVAGARELAATALEAAGYHFHRGRWRKRRGHRCADPGEINPVQGPIAGATQPDDG